jgi:hypothetical protein
MEIEQSLSLLAQRAIKTERREHMVRSQVEQRGFTVETPPKGFWKEGQRKLVQSLLVNGKLCTLRTIHNAHRVHGSRRWYAFITLFRPSLYEFGFTIVHFLSDGMKERWFVIPNTILKRLFNPCVKTKSRAQIAIPLNEKKGSRGPPARHDWLQYEDAWHLLS